MENKPEVRRDCYDLNLIMLSYIPTLLTGQEWGKSIRRVKTTRDIVDQMGDDGDFDVGEGASKISGRVNWILFAEGEGPGRFSKTNMVSLTPQEYVQLGRPSRLTSQKVYGAKE